MADPLVMSHDRPSPFPLRDAAIRAIAAAEYFKAAGHLPAWAREELETWSIPGAADDRERRSAFDAAR